jgi:hypothetical protein
VRFAAWAEKENNTDTQTVTIDLDSARLVVMALPSMRLNADALNLIDLKKIQINTFWELAYEAFFQ